MSGQSHTRSNLVHQRRKGGRRAQGGAAESDHEPFSMFQRRALDKGKARDLTGDVQPVWQERAVSPMNILPSATKINPSAIASRESVRKGQAVSTGGVAVPTRSAVHIASSTSRHASSTSDAAESSSSSATSTAVSTSVSSSISSQATSILENTESVEIIWRTSTSSMTEAVWSAPASGTALATTVTATGLASTATQLTAAAAASTSSTSVDLLHNKILLTAIIVGCIAAGGVVIFGLLWLCKRSGLGPTKKSRDKFNTGNWSPRSEGSSRFSHGLEIGEAYGQRGNLSFASLPAAKHGANDLESANHNMNSYASYGGNNLSIAAASNPILAPVFDPLSVDRFSASKQYAPFPQSAQPSAPCDVDMNNEASGERAQNNARRPSFIQRLIDQPSRKSTIDLTQVLNDRETGVSMTDDVSSQSRDQQRSGGISARSSQKSHRSVNSLFSVLRPHIIEERRRHSTWGFRRPTKTSVPEDSDFEGTIGAPDKEVPRVNRSRNGRRFACEESASEADSETDCSHSKPNGETDTSAWWKSYDAANVSMPQAPAMVMAATVPGRQLLAAPSSTPLTKSASTSVAAPFAELQKQQALLEQRMAADPSQTHAKLDDRINRWWIGSWDAEWPSPATSVETPIVNMDAPLSPRSMYQSSEETSPIDIEAEEAEDYLAASPASRRGGTVVQDAEANLARMASLRQHFPATTTLENWLVKSPAPRGSIVARLREEAAEPYEGSLCSPVVPLDSSSECEIDEHDVDFPIQRRASELTLTHCQNEVDETLADETAQAPIADKMRPESQSTEVSGDSRMVAGLLAASPRTDRPGSQESADGFVLRSLSVRQHASEEHHQLKSDVLKRLPAGFSGALEQQRGNRLSSAPVNIAYERPESKQGRRANVSRAASSVARMRADKAGSDMSMLSDDIAEVERPTMMAPSPALSSDSDISVRRWGHSGSSHGSDRSQSRLRYSRNLTGHRGFPVSYDMAPSDSAQSSLRSFSSGGRSSVRRDYDEEVRSRGRYLTNQATLPNDRSGSIKLQQQQQSRIVSSVQAHMDQIRRNRQDREQQKRFVSGPAVSNGGGIYDEVSRITARGVRIQY